MIHWLFNSEWAFLAWAAIYLGLSVLVSSTVAAIRQDEFKDGYIVAAIGWPFAVVFFIAIAPFYFLAFAPSEVAHFLRARAKRAKRVSIPKAKVIK